MSGEWISSIRSCICTICGLRKPCWRQARRVYLFHFVFFFQAEDGIRDLTVTGVQTCALPIFERVIRDIVDGRTTCLAVDTPVPSQFSHEILNANPYAYLDDAPLEERRARAVEKIGRASCRERV